MAATVQVPLINADRMMLAILPASYTVQRGAGPCADMTLMFDNSRSLTKAFTLARARAQKQVIYDCRDARFDQESGLLLAANEWLQHLAPLAGS